MYRMNMAGVRHPAFGEWLGVKEWGVEEKQQELTSSHGCS
jgi:hypothetical protein